MDDQTESESALGGLRILDLSRVLAGPWAAQTLADLGADVVKVESPAGGDDTRKWGPPFIAAADGSRSDAAYFACANRNKRSLAIDFSTPKGGETVRALAAKADVVIENFRPGGLAKYGLDYDTLSAADPRLIYCSITGFGQSGPYAHRPGYDFLIQGMGGLMSVTGQPEGTPGAEPMKVGVAVADLFTGMNAATAILAALAYRDRTGRGQHIDCALLDSQLAMLANQGANWLNGGVTPARMGNEHPNVVPYRVFGVADGHVIVACGNDVQFARLCAALGLPDLAEDARFATNEARIGNRDALAGMLGAALDRLSRAEAIALLEKADVPCGPINGVADVFADPHVRTRGAEVPMWRPDGTEVRVTAFPARLSASPATYRRAPPALGADTQAVMADWLGKDA